MKWKKEWKLFPIKKPIKREHYQEVGYGFLFKNFQIEFVEMYFDGDRIAVKPLAWFDAEDVNKIMNAVLSLNKYLERISRGKL